MKNYPESGALSRKRYCANRECGIEFYPKNPKAIYHCLECKNRETYLRQQDEYKIEFSWFKDFLHNRKVLATLYYGGTRKVNNEILNAFKFKRLVGALPETIVKRGLVIPFGTYALASLDDKDNYEIILLEEVKK